jgi:DNA-binding YbaB/EbfC family protein
MIDMASPFKGMGGGMPDMAKLMSLQKKLMEDGEKMTERLTNARIEGTAGGTVKATVDGHGSLVGITIQKEAVDPEDVEILQDMVVSAIQEAQDKAETLRNEEQKKMIPGGIPGLF